MSSLRPLLASTSPHCPEGDKQNSPTHSLIFKLGIDLKGNIGQQDKMLRKENYSLSYHRCALFLKHQETDQFLRNTTTVQKQFGLGTKPNLGPKS